MEQIKFMSGSYEVPLRWMSRNIDWGYVLVSSAIIWANVDQDLCHHMVTLGHNELTIVKYLHHYLQVNKHLYYAASTIICFAVTPLH